MNRRQALAFGASGLLFAAMDRAHAQQKLVAVKVGVPNAATDVGYFVAHAKGYFREEGLDVSFIPFPSAARMITPLATNELQVGAGGPSAGLYNAISRGMDIRIVSDKSKNVVNRGSQKLLVRKALIESGRVKELRDIKGLKFANGAPGSSASSVIYKVLQRAGLDIGDIEEVSMSFPQQVQALESGAIDIAMPPDPATTIAITRGIAIPILNGWDVYPVHQVAVTLYSGQFAKENPDAARRFMRAFLKGVRYHNDALNEKGEFSGARGDEVVKILTEYGPYKDPKVYRSFILAYCDPNGELDMTSLKEDIAIFQKLKLLEKPVDIEKVVDRTFLDWALKELGPYKPAAK
ncbi:MAG: ABC transporter substrate-binding protein [Beijerinckiaceae bacterium]